MEIREPNFYPGDKVLETDNQSGDIWTVQKITDYDFTIDLYTYVLKHKDGRKLISLENFLKPYIENPKSVWDLKEEDDCYLIFGDGKVSETTWGGCDKEFREIGNCFLTKEEAEFEVERRKIEMEMLRLGGRRKINCGKDNYFIMYASIEGLDYVNYHSMHEQGVIYFDTDIDAVKAVQEIGEDRIKKYIFGVEE